MNNWIIQVLGWVGAFILGVAVNLVTPAISNFLKNSSLSFRQRSIKYYREQYSRIKAYKENHSTLVIEILRLLTKNILAAFNVVGIGVIMILLHLSGSSTSASFTTRFIAYLLAGLGGAIASDFNDIHRLINKVTNFEKYRENIIKRLKKLDATLEEEEEYKKPIRKK